MRWRDDCRNPLRPAFFVLRLRPIGRNRGRHAGSLVRAMNERITTDDVEKVARLALLHLEPDELELFTSQLAAVLDHASDMQRLDLSDIEPMARPVPLSNVMRNDEIGELLDREEILAMAPSVEDGQFRVPPVLGEPA